MLKEYINLKTENMNVMRTKSQDPGQNILKINILQIIILLIYSLYLFIIYVQLFQSIHL